MQGPPALDFLCDERFTREYHAAHSDRSPDDNISRVDPQSPTRCNLLQTSMSKQFTFHRVKLAIMEQELPDKPAAMTGMLSGSSQ